MSTIIKKQELMDLISAVKNCFELGNGYIRINKYATYLRFDNKNYVENLYRKIFNSINSGKITYNIYSDIYLFLQTLRTSLLNDKVNVTTKKVGNHYETEISHYEKSPINKNTFNNLFPNVQKNYQNQLIRYNLIDLLRKTLTEIRKVKPSV